MSSPVPWGDAKTKFEAAALIDPTLVSWPNEGFVVPAPQDVTAWIAVEMTSTVLEPIELGGAVWEEAGILWVHIFVPWGSGSDVARLLAKNVVNAYRSLPVGDITYTRASFGDGGRDEVNGNWWRMTASIEWQYQDITV